jgi:hypothetical protein
MKRPAASVALLLGIVEIFGSSYAHAAERPCSPTEIEADTKVRSILPDLPGHIREALDARDDIDTCAQVKLSWQGSAIAVEVVLPDGRSASRSVTRGEDVMPTLEGLLLVPPPPPALHGPSSPVENTAPPAEGPPPTIAPAPTVLPAEAKDNTVFSTRDVKTRWPADPSGRVRFELSVATGARVGDGQAGVGLGLLSFIDIAGWLAGFGGRADYFHGPGGPPGTSLSLAALGGRRVRFGSVALDLTAGPALALQEVDRSVMASPQGVRTITDSGSGIVPRVQLGTRLVFRARSALRPFVGLDGDIGLVEPKDNLPSHVYQLPAWSMGLALGATVGTL